MYKLQITNKGKATSANLEFQKIFDISSTEDNIFIFKDEQFFVTPKDKLFKAPMIIIKCADRKKKMRYSLFIQNKLGISSSFYTGADFTNEIETVVKMQQRYETNESTGLYNTQVLKSNYDKWIADTTKGSLLIFLEMVNSQLYRALYGNGFHSRIMKEISKIIEKQLQCDKIYLIDDSILGVCYNGEKDREINYEIIKNCLILLNKTVAFGDGNDIAMPDIRFGVLDMTMAQLSYETAIRYAKIALDNAKRSEKSKIFIINGKESRRPTDFDAHGLLDLMIANNEIDVYYQPQIDTKTKKIVAFEALCRILSDKRNEITTFDFIRKAEIGGGIINLGKYIYTKAMAFATKIQEYGVEVSINVSPVQLMQNGFVNIFLEAYRGFGLKKGSICIEITEGALMYSFEEVQAKLYLLSDAGIDVHIDDFGVAYSSLMYVKRLPSTVLKIDKIFIDDLESSRDTEMIVKSIINMAKGLDKRVTAEGVETRGQYEILKKLNCDFIQGYYFSRALQATEAIAFLKDNI